MKRCFTTFGLALTALSQLASISPVWAATGKITLNITGSPSSTVEKSSNISGPSIVHGTANYTASFTNLTNTSGSLTVDMFKGGWETLCYASFTTIVSNGVCHVNLANGGKVVGGPTAICTYALGPVNTSTCDFTATFNDAAGTGSGPPP